jgi:hypothetical protein
VWAFRYREVLVTTTAHRVDPLAVGDQLKRLFLENERPEFPEWFDRAYPLAVREGAASWVSTETDGRVIAHVAGFPATISVQGRDVRGALLCNLMADSAHRTFFPVVAAVKRAVRELRQDGAEFVYTNPINPGSVSVMRAAGLKKVGTQNRFLLPLGDRRSPGGLLMSARFWALSRRLRAVEAVPAEIEEVVEWTVRERCEVSRVTVRRSRDVYFMRLGELRTDAYWGYVLRDSTERDVGAALVARPSAESGEARVITLRCRTLDRVAACVAAVGIALRRVGVRRANTTALEGTPFARALVQGGFVQRNEPWTIVAAGFSEVGRLVAEGLASSDLEKIDVD